MSESTLKYVSDLLESLDIPYEFMRWTEDVIPDYYFVGEYIENPSMTLEENGHQETTFILRGFTRQSWLLLERAKAKIEASMAKTAILDNGSGIAVFYESAMPVPTGDAELKSIKINLNIQEWKVK